MVCIKRIKNGLLILCSVVGLLALSLATLKVYADEEEKPNQLTPEQTSAIVQNCSNMKQSLVKLQRSDSRTRTYLGSAYEAVAGRFITPLNLRLVKNGAPSTDLFQIQNDFTAAQAEFRYEYVEYMRELEILTTIDCVLQPQEFYDKLQVVRERREKLRATTKRLVELTDQQYQTVEKLKAQL